MLNLYNLSILNIYFGLQILIELYMHTLHVPGGFSTSKMYLPVKKKIVKIIQNIETNFEFLSFNHIAWVETYLPETYRTDTVYQNLK